MTVASPIDMRINPNNVAQYYVLWGNGRIDNYGGVPAITDGHQWYDRPDQPVAVALHITNWTTGAGYILDRQGGFQPINGAPTLGGDPDNVGMDTFGVPYSVVPKYRDWKWNPNGTTAGYVLDEFGRIYPFGGANPPSRSGPRFTYPAARKLAVQFTPSVKSLTMDYIGGLHPDFAAVDDDTGAYWPGWDAARDLVVTDWNTPVKGYVLDLFGTPNGFGGAPTAWGGPYEKADAARCLAVVSAADPARFRIVWHTGQVREWVNSTPPTVTAGAGGSIGTNEVQTVTITGSPTAGTFTLTFSGQTTATIARTATAAQIQAALEALSNIGVGDVSVTGTAPTWTVTFQGALGLQNVAAMTAAHTFTGGTTPGVTIATTQAGVAPVSSPPPTVTTTTRPTLTWGYTDPQGDTQDEWQLYVFTQAYVTANPSVGTDPSAHAASAVVFLTGRDPTTRGTVADYDFINGSWRYYIRAKDTSGQWSAWSTIGWTQSVTPPSTPTGMTATGPTTAQPDNWSVALSVTVPAGGLNTHVRFEYSDDSGVTWLPVRGAEAIPRATTATASDRDKPHGASRQYSAISYASSPRIASARSNVATAAGGRRVYTLHSTASPSLGGEIMVVDAPSSERDSKSTVHEPAGDEFYLVVSDGVPKRRQFPVGVETNSRAERDRLENVLLSNSTLVYRDPFGDVIYCRYVGGWGKTQQKLPAYPTELTPLRDNHKHTFKLVEVRRPTSLAVSSTVPPGPT